MNHNNAEPAKPFDQKSVEKSDVAGFYTNLTDGPTQTAALSVGADAGRGLVNAKDDVEIQETSGRYPL